MPFVRGATTKSTADDNYFNRSNKTRYRYVKIGSGDPFARIKLTTAYGILGKIGFLETYMPHLMKNQIYIEDIERFVAARIEAAYEMAMQAAYNELRIIFYNNIIQYYTFITTVYIRHGEGSPGTGSGSNLLSADQIQLHGSGFSTQIIYSINSGAMSGYPSVGTDTVLDMVISGSRPIGGGRGYMQFASWETTYSDSYITCLDTINDTANMINSNWQDFFLKFYNEALSKV